MSYSDYQRRKIRKALQHFYEYEEVYDESGEYSWKDVREAIAEETDVEIGKNAKLGAERLRQFVEGNPDPKNPGKRSYPKKLDWLPAAVDFLMSEDYQLLMPGELEEEKADFVAAFKLSEYFNEGKNNENVVLSAPQGIFSTTRTIEWGYEYIELIFQRDLSGGVFQIIEVRQKFDKDTFENNSKNTYEWRRENSKTKELHTGWSVKTPEKILLLFMKGDDGAGNYQYISVAANTDYLDGLELKELLLYRQEDIWPLYEEENKIRDVSSSYLESSIFHFIRNVD